MTSELAFLDAIKDDPYDPARYEVYADRVLEDGGDPQPWRERGEWVKRRHGLKAVFVDEFREAAFRNAEPHSGGMWGLQLTFAFEVPATRRRIVRERWQDVRLLLKRGTMRGAWIVGMTLRQFADIADAVGGVWLPDDVDGRIYDDPCP